MGAPRNYDSSDYGIYAVPQATIMEQVDSIESDWACYQNQTISAQWAPSTNYALQPAGFQFDTSFWSPELRSLQSQPYAPFAMESYASMEYEDSYEDSEFMAWSTTEDSMSQIDTFSDQGHAQSCPSLSYTESHIPVSSSSNMRHTETQAEAQSNVGHTEIDSLMLDIQTSASQSSASPHDSTSQHKAKKHICPYTQCDKSFSQRTHLLIHIRSHSGEKPYVCGIPDCEQRFSQLGNLKTHERRHRGEKPFVCQFEGCDKRFSQRSNLRSHKLSVHGLSDAFNSSSNESTPTSAGDCRARFECRLDDCAGSSPDGSGKPFTQLGNLKAHQNKFHTHTLRTLEQKFATLISNAGGAEQALSLMDEDERELWRYFESMYRNCNKGIKGRGKGRKVAG